MQLFVSCVYGLDLPEKILSNLKAEEFQKREAAQAELLVWACKDPPTAMDVLFQQSREADDPEIRDRCLAVLRELVFEEYRREGEGFIGILMRDELANVPGDPKRRAVIRVIQVVEDSAASTAGLQINDLILGIGEKVWHDGSASEPFSQIIRELKPGSKIVLRILRDGNVKELGVTLGRRPMVANPFLDNQQIDPTATEQAAKDAYFRRWLERRKARK